MVTESDWNGERDTEFSQTLNSEFRKMAIKGERLGFDEYKDRIIYSLCDM